MTHFDPTAATSAFSKDAIPDGPMFGVATGTLPAMLWRLMLFSAILATPRSLAALADALQGSASIAHLKTAEDLRMRRSILSPYRTKVTWPKE